jgi:hypothetical protein
VGRRPEKRPDYNAECNDDVLRALPDFRLAPHVDPLADGR